MSIQEKFNLTGKVAIVTGASKGIGKAIARGLAEYGAKVVVSSRKQDAVDVVAREFVQLGYEATGIACHVGDAQQREELVAKTMDTYGRIDVLVNNAATNPVFDRLERVAEESFDKIFNVNLKACWDLANRCHPIMREGGGGSIVNVASVEGMVPSPKLGLYSVSKAALIMLTKSQAKEWGKDGIRSNALCPGLVKTKFSQALWTNDHIMRAVERALPAGRAATPDEMAGLAVFLASDASSYCTGQNFTADGGHLLGAAL